MSSQETIAKSAATHVMDMTTNLTMKIDLITRDISRTYLKARLYSMSECNGLKNALTICNYITAELNEINIKPSTREDKIKTLV